MLNFFLGVATILAVGFLGYTLYLRSNWSTVLNLAKHARHALYERASNFLLYYARSNVPLRTELNFRQGGTDPIVSSKSLNAATIYTWDHEAKEVAAMSLDDYLLGYYAHRPWQVLSVTTDKGSRLFFQASHNWTEAHDLLEATSCFTVLGNRVKIPFQERSLRGAAEALVLFLRSEIVITVEAYQSTLYKKLIKQIDQSKAYVQPSSLTELIRCNMPQILLVVGYNATLDEVVAWLEKDGGHVIERTESSDTALAST